MSIIKLNDGYSLAIDAETRRLRLTILNGDEELVCHKTTVSELRQFLQQTDAHLFKGRLQLDKIEDRVVVTMKGEVIGSIPGPEFSSLLDQQQAKAVLH